MDQGWKPAHRFNLILRNRCGPARPDSATQQQRQEAMGHVGDADRKP